MISEHNKDRRSTSQIAGSFRAKSAGVSLVAILMIGISYLVQVLVLLPGEQAVPVGALSLTLTAIVLIIVVETVFHIVLFIGAGRIEAYTERDGSIALVSRRNAHVVLTATVFAAVLAMFAGFTSFWMGCVLLIGFVVSEGVRFTTQLVCYRQAE